MSYAVPTPTRGQRFEVRRVDDERRAYVFEESLRNYADACMFADIARVMTGDHFIIWDARERRATPYDTRQLGAKETRQP